MMVSRLNEKEAISKVIRERKNLFLYGPPGAGKTFILHRVLEELLDMHFLYASDSSTLKRALVGLLSKDVKPHERSRSNLLCLKKMLYNKIREEPSYLVFDHLTRVGPKYFSFLENLSDKVPMIIIAKSPYAKDIGDCFRLLWSFECLEISNFKQKQAYAFIEFYRNDFQMGRTSWELFKSGVFHFSSGNPRAIKEICRYARENKYKKGDMINLNLINLDRKISVSCRRI